MFYDYAQIKEELRKHHDPDKRRLIDKWDKISQAECLEDEPFYEYLKKFKIRDMVYKVPDEVSEDFDWPLLSVLTVGSFSCEYHFEYLNCEEDEEIFNHNQLPELYMTVYSCGTSVTKKISELFSFQIEQLYFILLTEQISLHMLKMEDNNEMNVIEDEREIRLKIFKQKKAEGIKIKNDIKQKKERQNILKGYLSNDFYNN